MNTSLYLGRVRAAVSAARLWALAHKFWAAVIIIFVVWGGSRIYSAATAPSTATRYVTTTVATGTVVATMTETGQVSSSQELSLSPKASGTVTAVYVQPGQTVAAGQLIAQLDATDALQSLANAKLALESQQISYEQAVATSTLALNLLSAENTLSNAQTALQKTHDSTYASLSSMYADFSTLVSNIDNHLHSENVQGRSGQQNLSAFTDLVSQRDPGIVAYSSAAETSYQTAVASYNTALAAYKAASLSSTDDELVALTDTTYQAAKDIATAAKDAHDFFDRVSADYTLYNLTANSTLASLLSASQADTLTINNDLSTVLTLKSNIVSAEQTLAQAEDSLSKAQGGANALTVQQAQLSLQQAEQSVTNAEQTVADYSVYAPFSGTIASVGVKKYDQASSGTAVATLVASQQTVDISVNEVDAANLKIGEKATLTFDALPNIMVAGTVSSINTIGSVSSGVVSYDAIITFDTPAPAVLPGMSATADIVTGTETGLVVPQSAVKTIGTQKYVETFTPPLANSATATGVTSATPPTRVTVTTGLSGDTNVVIESGLTDGTQVVTQTIAGTSGTASTAASAPSIFNAARPSGARTGGGGAAVFRAGGG